MSKSTFSGVKIVGISCGVPKTVIANDYFNQFMDPKIVKNIEKMTGIVLRRQVEGNVCTSDLCVAAANDLLEKIDWQKESLDAVVFISQGPDYACPGTSFSIHERLGLPTSCVVLDLNISCAGYVYGLWLCANMMTGSKMTRVLFLNGDVSSINRYREKSLDRNMMMLFGDAGAATALELDPEASEMNFVLGADGKGLKNLYVPAGSLRNPSTAETRKRVQHGDGSIRSLEDPVMDGLEIFNFTLERVPEVLGQLKDYAKLDFENVDYFLFHQANLFILKHLMTLLKLNPKKVPISINEFGNTSSASVPLTMVTRIADQLKTKSTKVVMSGFGAGYSWGACSMEIPALKCASLVEI